MTASNSPAPRLLVAAIVLAIAALSPAPINDSSHRPKHWTAEQSQSQLAAEQRYNGARPEVGRVEQDTDRRNVAPEAGQPGASDAVAAASRAPAASEVIADASAHVEGAPAPRGLPWWLLAAVVGGGAFALSRGLKAWADKSLPTPDHIR